MADYISNYTGAQIDNAIGVGLSKGSPNGIASLDASGKVPSAQLPDMNYAHAGYGLGSSWNTAPSNDANLITGSGFQMANTNVPFGTNWWGILSFVYDNSSATQWAMPQNTSQSYFGSVCKREKRNGTWSEWEWVNPPMAAGVEYRTTELYQGKPVYKKMIAYTGALTAGYSSMEHNIANIDAICGCYAELYTTGSTRLSMPRFESDNFIAFSASHSTIIKQSNYDRSAYSARVTLSYTKSTD